MREASLASVLLNEATGSERLNNLPKPVQQQVIKPKMVPSSVWLYCQVSVTGGRCPGCTVTGHRKAVRETPLVPPPTAQAATKGPGPASLLVLDPVPTGRLSFLSSLVSHLLAVQTTFLIHLLNPYCIPGTVQSAGNTQRNESQFQAHGSRQGWHGVMGPDT